MSCLYQVILYIIPCVKIILKNSFSSSDLKEFEKEYLYNSDLKDFEKEYL